MEREMKRLVLISLLSMVLGFTGTARATGVSLTVVQIGSWLQAEATGTFSIYQACMPGDPPTCYDFDSGFVRININDSEICWNSGSLTATCSAAINPALLPQGDNSVTAKAIDIRNAVKITEKHVFIDNTPTFIGLEPAQGEQLEGLLNITGEAYVTDNPEGYEAKIIFEVEGNQFFEFYKGQISPTDPSFQYIIRGRFFYKDVYSPTDDFSFSEDFPPGTIGSLYTSTARWAPGIYPLKVRATSVNNTTVEKAVSIIVGCDDGSYTGDSDLDGLSDCEDACPVVKGNAADGC